MKPNPGDGLLLHRHIPPLTRRYMAYFCSGAHTLSSGDKVYTLRGDKAQIDKFAGKNATVKGKADGNTIVVDSIAAAKS